jgi:CBS domain containing-hemolysin-like protein
LDTISYIIISLLFSAFFSGMEIAFVSSNKLRFELEKKQRNLTSSILGIFYRHPQQFISTMLVGNNIALVVYGLMMADFLQPLFFFTGNQLLITLMQTILATIIVLFTGEFLPKTIFRVNPNLWLRVFSWLLLLFYTAMYPIAYFTTWLSRIIIRIFNPNATDDKTDNVFSRIDLSYLLQESFDNNNHNEDIEHEVKFFQNALDFSKIKLRDCSVPRTEIIALEYETSLDTLKQTFIETGYSKIPIYRENIDNIIGYIHASEMFEHPNDWKKYIKQIPIVPENMTAHKLMKLFMLQKKSIAVVVDEHGGTNGIVTLEDIIEEIFGEIEDEHDNREYIAKQLGENEFLLSGRMEVQLANEKFGLNIPESDNYETIAGFILHHHQHFPKLHEVILIGNFKCKCIKVTNNRIELIRLFLGG